MIVRTKEWWADKAILEGNSLITAGRPEGSEMNDIDIYDRIKLARVQLDQRTDDSVAKLKEAEQKLTEAGACVEAKIGLQGDLQWWQIGWARAITKTKRWEFVATHIKKDGNVSSRLGDAPRVVRIAAAARLEDLLVTIAEAMESGCG